MKIISFNVREWSRDLNPWSPYFWMKRMAAMRRMIKDENPEVICFQELSWPASLYVPTRYRNLIVDGSTSHPIYARQDIDAFDGLHNSFYSWAKVKQDNGWVNIYSAHLSSNSDEKRIKQLNKIADKTKLENRTIVCGDFNAISDWIKPYLPDLTLLNGNIDNDTFKKFDGSTAARIDHFFGRGVTGIAYDIINNYGAERMSDHYPVVLNVSEK